MTPHRAHIITLAALLVGISALVPSTRLHAQQPLDAVRALAEEGDADAQFNLGKLFYIGQEGLPQDFAEAVRWYRLAADQGHADAQESLGFMYRIGIFVPQDTAEAARWYRLAADQGHPHAQTELGRMHYFGRGIPQNERLVSFGSWASVDTQKRPLMDS